MADTRVRAPEFPSNLEWPNMPRPVTLAELRGRVVLLHFWSAASLESLKALDDLRYLQNQLGDRLVIIGVHAPRYPHESDVSAVSKAIKRWHIPFPVVHDPELQLWRLFRIKAWPSLLYIDPEGMIVGVLRNTDKRQKLEKTIAGHLQNAPETSIDASALVPTKAEQEHRSRLRYPGKLCASEGRLYISDSGRNRVIECDHRGRMRRIFGSGSPGLVDGAAEYASFNNPQGLVKIDEDLYIADAGNHSIRRVRLTSGDIETVIGTGELPESQQASLSFPWDLAYRNGLLYVAMAGANQIWKLTLNNRDFQPYSGQQLAGLVDGPVRNACFAEPLGLAVYDDHLLVADAQNSAIRLVRLATDTVALLVGSPSAEHGDRGGFGTDARLQHPGGIAVDPERELLWILDTYNNKLKLLSLVDYRLRDYPVQHTLEEPGGLDVIGNDLFIANTNAQQILRIDLEKRSEQVIEVDEAH